MLKSGIMKNKKLTIITLIIVAWVGVWQIKQKIFDQKTEAPAKADELTVAKTVAATPTTAPTTDITATETARTEQILLNIEQDSADAWQMLQNQAQVDFEQYDFGVFIKGINGLAADNKNYWAIYINDEFAQTGIDQLEVKKGDVVKLVYEKLENYEKKSQTE